jgi:hypothetical protein
MPRAIYLSLFNLRLRLKGGFFIFRTQLYVSRLRRWFYSRELFFTEMTKKMAHVCENYDNWFINQLTTNKHVVFVEILRG